MSRRKRILFVEEEFYENEKGGGRKAKALREDTGLNEDIIVLREDKGLRKRQQVKYYESSSSEEDIDVKIIEPIHSKKSENKSSNSNTDDSDFESEDSDDENPRKKSKSNKTAAGQSSSQSISEYEKEMLEKKTKNLEFLKTIGMDEAKNDFLDLKPKKRPYVKKEPSERSNGPKRVSQREKARVDFTEFFFKIEQDDVKNEELDTFKKVLRFESDYEDFVEDFNEILEGDDILQTPVLYNKDVLKKLSKKTEIHSNRLYRPCEMSWYPSSEHLILVIAESNGFLTLCNFEESDYLYKFSAHTKKISNVQFNSYNTFQLLSSSSDGLLLCCDMQKQMFTEVLKNNTPCTYFDIVSPSCYLVSTANGHTLIVDKRSRHNQYKRYVLHDSSINTIQVHPVEKKYFVTSGTDKKVRVWDLRKLSSGMPVIESTLYDKSVASAFFSPLSGKHLLVSSRDNKLCIFDSSRIVEERMTFHKSIKYAANKKSVGQFISPTWLPHSDDTFAWYNRDRSEMLQIYDKDFKVCDTVMDGIKGTRVQFKFHPFKPAIASVTCTQSIRISASPESSN